MVVCIEKMCIVSRLTLQTMRFRAWLRFRLDWSRLRVPLRTNHSIDAVLSSSPHLQMAVRPAYAVALAAMLVAVTARTSKRWHAPHNHRLISLTFSPSRAACPTNPPQRRTSPPVRPSRSTLTRARSTCTWLTSWPTTPTSSHCPRYVLTPHAPPSTRPLGVELAAVYWLPNNSLV